MKKNSDYAAYALQESFRGESGREWPTVGKGKKGQSPEEAASVQPL